MIRFLYIGDNCSLQCKVVNQDVPANSQAAAGAEGASRDQAGATMSESPIKRKLTKFTANGIHAVNSPDASSVPWEDNLRGAFTSGRKAQNSRDPANKSRRVAAAAAYRTNGSVEEEKKRPETNESTRPISRSGRF